MKKAIRADTSKWMSMLITMTLLINETSCQETNEVCIVGYIMDLYCIDRGRLLDNPSVMTLEAPEKHSAHCLLEITSCIDSGYEVLVEPIEGTSTFSRAFQLDPVGNQMFYEFGLTVGQCADCSGTQRQGLNATIIGSIVPDSGSSTIPETIAVTKIRSFSQGCGTIPLAVPKSVITSSGRFQNIILQHGALMLTGWGFLLPSGVLTARLLRHRPNGLWFKIHQSVQVLGLILAIVGWSIALINFSVFGSVTTSFIHGALGMTVMVLGILQPLNAILRPHATEPGQTPTTKRITWERLHKGVGYLLLPLSAVTIMLGTTRVPVPSTQTMFQIFYGVIVGLLVLFFVFLTRDKKKYSSVPTQDEELATSPRSVE